MAAPARTRRRRRERCVRLRAHRCHTIARHDADGQRFVDQQGGAHGQGSEQAEQQEHGGRQHEHALRPRPSTGDRRVDGVIDPARRQQGQRNTHGSGVSAHRRGCPTAQRARRHQVLELGRLTAGQLEVDGHRGKLQRAVVVVVSFEGGHARPSSASRRCRSWIRARHISVRVAPSVRPSGVRDLAAREALRCEHEGGTGIGRKLGKGGTQGARPLDAQRPRLPVARARRRSMSRGRRRRKVAPRRPRLTAALAATRYSQASNLVRHAAGARFAGRGG